MNGPNGLLIGYNMCSNCVTTPRPSIYRVVETCWPQVKGSYLIAMLWSSACHVVVLFLNDILLWPLCRGTHVSCRVEKYLTILSYDGVSRCSVELPTALQWLLDSSPFCWFRSSFGTFLSKLLTFITSAFLTRFRCSLYPCNGRNIRYTFFTSYFTDLIRLLIY